jgi:osmotically-inducible protein OsmY
MAETTPSDVLEPSPPWWPLPPDFWRGFGVLACVLVPLITFWVQRTMDSLGTTLAGEEFKEVQVHFIGQQAVLTGRVLDAAASASASKVAAEEFRVGPRWWTGAVNPISSVRNEIVVRPNPPGFLVLIREREQAMLAGETWTAEELDKLLSTLQPHLPARPDTLLLHVATERGPSGKLDVTLESLKTLLTSSPPREPLLAAATLGSTAQLLDLNAEAATLEAKFHTEGWDWAHSQALVQQLRKWVEAAIENDRRMALPLPHLTLLAAGNEVFLRGQVATAPLRDSITEAARLFYGPDRLHAEISLTEDRRPVPQANATLTSFPALPDPTASGVLGFAIPGAAWRSAELPDSGFTMETLPTLNLLAPDFDSSLATSDFIPLVAQHERHRTALAEMALKATYPVSFAALLLLGKQAYLHGDIATAAAQESILAAARQAYPEHTVEDHLRLNELRRPLTPEQVKHFSTGFPPAPRATSPGVIAFIVPGQEWKSSDIPPVELRAEEFDEFVHHNIIPSSFPADDAKADFNTLRTLLVEHFKKIPSMILSQIPPEPFLTLLAQGKQVYLRGNAGSEKMKQEVLAAAQKAYFDREVIDEIRIDSKPPIPLPSALTVKSFPPRPTFDGPGVLGFVRPGQPWLQVPLTVDHPKITLEWLEAQGLFSKDFDAKKAWPDYEVWLSKLEPKSPPPPAPK